MKTKINLRDLKLKRLRFKRLRYRTGLILLGIIATAILAFNFWFIDHAEEAIEQIVNVQSKGKLRLQVAKFRFNWLKNKIELDKTSIISVDSTAPVAYTVNTEKITIKARGFLPLLFKKQILIDSIRLYAPNIVFTRVGARIKRSDDYKDSVRAAKGNEKFSVAEEMGRISQSITDAINVLQVHRFRLDNGSFSLIDKTKPNESPFIVNKVYIELDNLKIDSTKNNKKAKDNISFTDNIAIRTSDQNISFPGGRHFLSFKNFRVNLQNRRVEFDSCTLRALKGDSSKTSFRIFFDKLQLTNINFDSLYSSETIIADSVFCSRPQIFLDIDSDQKTAKSGKKKTGTQKIDDLIQQLLGDMKLAYVGVKDADINVNTIRKGEASTFSSRDNNFEMYGLTVRQNEERPVSLNKFIMTLHNYENLLHNGRYAISFDSIGFEDDVINLNRFSFKEFDKGRTIKSLSMPSFQVRGLSWESLLYDNVFAAESAVFYKPLVDYTVNRRNGKAKARSLFGTLNSIDDVMDLKNLKIQQGAITLHFGKRSVLNLQNTNLDLRAAELAGAHGIKTVQRSVNVLNFDKGMFKRGAFTAYLNKVHLAENKSGLKARNMLITSSDLKANANNIHIGSVVLDSVNQSIVVDGVRWANASILTTGSPTAEAKKETRPHRRRTSVMLKNITGHNTDVNLALKQGKVTGNFNTIVLKEFKKKAGGKPEIRGVSFDGRNFLMLGTDMRVAVSKMDITDNNNSVLRNIEFEKINKTDSITAFIPQLTIIPDITEMMSGSLTLNGLVLQEPVIKARIGKKDSAARADRKKTTGITLGSALLQRPDIKLTLINKNDAASYIRWDGVKMNSYLKISNLTSTADMPVKADQVKMFLTNFEFISAKGKKTATNDNKLNLEFNNVVVNKNGDNNINWKTDVNILSLDKLFFDSLGKKNAELTLDKGDVKNIALNSKYMKNIGDVIANSRNLDMSGTNGSFRTWKNELHWFGFTVNNGMFGVDSLRFSPKQTVEAYRIAKAFNEDYLKIKTGKITGGPVDLVKLNSDSILNIGHIELNDIDLLTFKDKTQPDTAKKYKPLPAEMLLKLKNALRIDSIKINNMNASYWEINPNTDTLGIVPVSGLNVLIRNIKNYDIKSTDSIYIVASANVLNSLYTTLNASQSYTDSLGYLHMHLATGPMDLTKFNTVLVPLVGAKVFKGNLHRLEVDAAGDNNAAIGSARMYYNGLNIGLLNKKDLPNQTFINKLVSKIAMAFVIRNNNRGKESLVFFERWQDKSPINYIVKTTLEGIKSSIGLPGAKKKLRKYRKSMKEKQ